MGERRIALLWVYLDLIREESTQIHSRFAAVVVGFSRAFSDNTVHVTTVYSQTLAFHEHCLLHHIWDGTG